MLLRAAASSPALFRSAGSPMMAGMPPTTASEAGTTSGLIHCSRRPMLLCCECPPRSSARAPAPRASPPLPLLSLPPRQAPPSGSSTRRTNRSTSAASLDASVDLTKVSPKRRVKRKGFCLPLTPSFVLLPFSLPACTLLPRSSLRLCVSHLRSLALPPSTTTRQDQGLPPSHPSTRCRPCCSPKFCTVVDNDSEPYLRSVAVTTVNS